MAYSVVLDTCVLYPAYLRDTLLRLAVVGTYRPLWSQHILDELERNVGDAASPEKAERIITLMREHFEDAQVTGYEPLIDAMTNHPKDRHVLAAAVRSNAAAIVTFNDADFPEESTEPYSVDVVHPDKFLLDQLGLAPGIVMAALEKQTQGYHDPPMDVAGLASALDRSGTPLFASEIRRHLAPTD